MMESNQQAYDEAGKVDKRISDLLGTSPITKENAAAWAIFTRTIKSTVDILDSELERFVNPTVEIKKVSRTVYNLKWEHPTTLDEKRELLAKLTRNGSMLAATKDADFAWLPNLRYSTDKAIAFAKRCGCVVESTRQMK